MVLYIENAKLISLYLLYNNYVLFYNVLTLVAFIIMHIHLFTDSTNESTCNINKDGKAFEAILVISALILLLAFFVGFLFYGCKPHYEGM